MPNESDSSKPEPLNASTLCHGSFRDKEHSAATLAGGCGDSHQVLGDANVSFAACDLRAVD